MDTEPTQLPQDRQEPTKKADGDEVEPKYRMTVNLNVLYHLGIGLYSNIPAVLS